MSKRNRNKRVPAELFGGHTALLTPPRVIDSSYKEWYRRGSDMSQVAGPGEEDEEDEKEIPEDDGRPKRVQWGSQIEFLMSCIATSVGLGNVWRFPFVAYKNGGGAFLIPYIIVLILVGKPMYYLECILGQFSSRNSVRVWSLCPALKGIGYSQAMAASYIVSYYVVIISICQYYLAKSFQRSPLPWAVCADEWEESCVPSDMSGAKELNENASSSAELYFVKTVLQQSDGIEHGIGIPIWYLTLCLFISWLIIFFIVARGVKSSGKAAYFLAMFPYLVMIILFISTVFLPGAGKGILFFITPKWSSLIQLDVWYAAVTQVFFSLSVGTGAIIMFSSYNGFTQNIYRDSMIVTTLDTFTSLLSGFTIFGILGNLANQLKSEVEDVIGSAGTGLVFVSYPDAIAKTFAPQLYSVLFFLMMVVLGMGSAVALLSSINTVALDAFPKVRTIYISATSCGTGFLIGTVFVTPGGQFILELVDYYGGTFLVLFGALAEIIGVFWIYGLENLCLDLEFMLGMKTSMYWRMTWGLFTPGIMLIIFIYSLFSFETLLFGDYYVYPTLAYISGYIMLFAGILIVPIFIFIAMCKRRAGGLKEATNGVNVVGDGDQVNIAVDPSPENDPSPSKDVLVDDLPTKLQNDGKSVPERAKWDNQTEFLMSCIATSVGLGNVWRFPFVAYQNGGGAFLIPYIIVLMVIGLPMYFLETVLGQFSSSNCVKIWALSPAMKGTGYAQALGASYVLSYYVSIIALCLYYLVMSFNSELPWSQCQAEWENCVPSGVSANASGVTGEAVSSAELYFTQTVLRQSDGIHGGIGAPLWDLTLCLLISWAIIFVIVARGVKSSGKAAYFLALFPYVIMIILLIRAVTLPGASNGILFFITPDWGKILELRVWYAAVTQVFFSLSVCSGALIMFASYNSFSENVYRDSIIVSMLDTCTSLMSGFTIFGILGNLAYQLGYDDVSQVIGSGGTSLAFISYPDAIAQSPFLPQLFAVLFFLMMAVLGIGSGVALLSTVNTILLDSFPKVPVLYMSLMTCTVGFLVGLVYVTPGGQYILELVDFYGGTFMRLFAAIAETIGVFWIYGLENLCLDIEYMLGIKAYFYWRFCWGVITPVLMVTVFMYAMITTEALVFGGTYTYPAAAYFAGNAMQYIGIAMVPLFIGIALYKNRSSKLIESVKRSFGKKETYGPQDLGKREEWRLFRRDAKASRNLKRKNWLHHIFMSLYGGYRWND